MPRLRARASAPSKRPIESDAPTTPARAFPSTNRVVSAPRADENEPPSKADYKRDARESAVAALAARREGTSVTLMQCWDATPSGRFEASNPSSFTGKHRKKIKARIWRQARNPLVAYLAAQRCPATRTEGSGEVEGVESASKESRESRRREATWVDSVEKVRFGFLTPQDCKLKLEREFNVKVQVKHVELAVKQLKRGLKITKLKDLRETRGRKPLLSEANEKLLAEHIRGLDESNVPAPWKEVSYYARSMWRTQEGLPAKDKDDYSPNDRFTYKWYVNFSKRHNLRITKLSTSANDDYSGAYGMDVNEMDLSGLDVSPEYVERLAESLRNLEKRISHGELIHNKRVSAEEAEAWTFVVKTCRAMYRRRGYELPR